MVRIGWVSGERCTLSLKFHLPALSVWRVSAVRVLLWYFWGAGVVLLGTLLVMVGWECTLSLFYMPSLSGWGSATRVHYHTQPIDQSRRSDSYAIAIALQNALKSQPPKATSNDC